MNSDLSSGDVWIKKSKRSSSSKRSNAVEVENKLREYFNSGYPVALSSGRSAISMVFRYCYNRGTVRIFPYASQCVVNSILEAGLTPSTPLKYSTLDISYNQWGRLNLDLENPPFIEDSVDSFYPVHAEILRSGAEFEVWSLQKIFGIDYGAVLWCKSESDAKKIRYYRDHSPRYVKMFKRTLLRPLKHVHEILYNQWERLEHQHLPLFRFEYGQIFAQILLWEDLYIERKKNYYEALHKLGLNNAVNFEEFRDVIPVVIEIPKHLPTDGLQDIISLHRIVNVDKVSSVSIFAYQVKL
jgi:putative PLP-dependent aminotransferase (TIGR04422 family)